MMIAKMKRAEHIMRLRQAPPLASGFTLIEMMITLTIVGILIIFALPSLSNLVLDQKIKSATFDVFSSLVYTRSEALKRNSNIDIVATSNNWANGWKVQTQGTVAVLKNQDALSGIILTATDSANNAVNTITYRHDGRLNNTTAPTFVLKIANNATVNPRCVLVDLSGLPNIKVAQNFNPTNQCN